MKERDLSWRQRINVGLAIALLGICIACNGIGVMPPKSGQIAVTERSRVEAIDQSICGPGWDVWEPGPARQIYSDSNCFSLSAGLKETRDGWFWVFRQDNGDFIELKAGVPGTEVVFEGVTFTWRQPNEPWVDDYGYTHSQTRQVMCFKFGDPATQQP